jgi:hypothetical protein
VTADAEHARQERLAALATVETALADPVRLVRALTDAEDDEDAVRRISAAFDVDEQQARVLMDLQFGRLTRAGRLQLTEELRILRTEWGPPVEAGLVLTGRRSAVLSTDGTEHRVTAGGLTGLLDRVVALLWTEIAVPQLRPVVVAVTGAVAGPVGMTVRPDGTASFDYVEAER